jgi:hypothetical protein
LTLITYLATALSALKMLAIDNLPIKKLFANKATVIALLASAYCLWMISSLNVKIIQSGMVVLLVSIPFYFMTVRQKR